MGYTSYSVSSRNMRATSSGYYSKGVDEIFTQNKKRMIHETMDPSNAIIRECRDSEAHPNSLPIILALDVTGSMGQIPHHLVKDGLPKLMGDLIQKGVEDASLLFLAIGDTIYDKYPLQVGQFESGDAELDTWLTRTYIEQGGGGNFGESYLLAWYFAAHHTATDAYDKRKEKGFLFTVGDEPSLDSLPSNVVKELMKENTQVKSFTDKELLELAKEKYNVFHLHVLEGSAGHRSIDYWKNMLGQNCIEVSKHEDIPKMIIQTVLENYKNKESQKVFSDKKQGEENKEGKEDIIL